MPLSQMGLRIRLAAQDDLAEITDIVVAAFHSDTDAISRHLFPLVYIWPMWLLKSRSGPGARCVRQ